MSRSSNCGMAFELSMHLDRRWELLGSCVGLPYVFYNLPVVEVSVIIAIAMVLHDDRFNSYQKECNQGHVWDQMKQQHDYIS